MCGRPNHNDLTRFARSLAQYQDNLKWIREAGKNKMVVGSEARILYSNCEGRSRLALEFNKAVRDGRLKGMVVLSRDHHDVSGTDSPYRETSNITDGSMFCADMAIQNVLGDAARGATWVSIHNGGGEAQRVAKRRAEIVPLVKRIVFHSPTLPLAPLILSVFSSYAGFNDNAVNPTSHATRYARRRLRLGRGYQWRLRHGPRWYC